MTESIPAFDSKQRSSREFVVNDPKGVAVAADPAHLVKLLQQQRDIYQRLQSLAGTQSQLVESGSSQPLLAVLAQRQQLVDELARLHTEMTPYRSRWQEVYDGLPAPQKSEVAGLVKAVEGMLAAIIDQDNRDRKQLEEAKVQIGSELTRLAQAGVAAAAYQGQRSSPPTDAGNAMPLTDRQG